MPLRRTVLFSIALAIAVPAAKGNDWQLWSPRPEIAPKAERDSRSGDLVLKGAGNPAVNGGWERNFGSVTPGHWYQLTVHYRAAGLTDAPRQVVARLDWLNAEGRRTGQPEYAYVVKAEGDGARFTLQAPAPEKAAAVKVQLMLLEAPNAVVRWSGVKFESVDAPAARPATIATLRLRPRGADPVAKFVDLAMRDVPAGTDMILLPEGVTVVGTGKSYADVAEPLNGPSVQRLAALARAKSAWVVAGVYEREGPVIYNTSVLLDRKGNLAGKYRKVYIPREETEGGITAGSDYPVFDTDFGRIGMMICWDVQYTDPARAMALSGAEMILVPIWGGNETLARARAIENQVYLISSGYDFPSAVYSPGGETLAREETDGKVAVVKLDLAKRNVEQWLGHVRGRFHREVRSEVPANPPGRR